MRFIVNRKIFDTNKAKLIVSYSRKGFLASVPQNIDLYRTQSGKWLEVDVKNLRCEEKKDEDVENIFLRLSNIELYEKYFGKLEEI